MKKFEEYKEGESLEHSSQCWIMSGCLVTMHNDYVRTVSDLSKKCPACPTSSVCMALMSNQTKDVYPKKVESNTQDYKPTYKTKRGQKRKG